MKSTAVMLPKYLIEKIISRLIMKATIICSFTEIKVAALLD